MKKTALLLCAWLALGTSFAQTARKFSVNITADGKASMTVYLPAEPKGRAVVGCPGGGYQHLSIQNEGHDWAEWFTQQGIAYCVLTYRMPEGDRSKPMSDAQQAIRTVRDSAQAWGINPRDVGIMGFSAGGHLASTVSTHSEYDCRPNFSILFYPVISMNERETHRGSCVNFLGAEGQKDEQLVKAFSNQNAVRRHLTPPAIVLTANDDRVVPPVTNGVAYYSAMRRSGLDCSLFIYPTGGHGFGFRSSWRFHDQMLSDLKTWLDAHKAPREDAKVVACIGNSITDGSGIDMNDQLGYPAQLQQLLGSDYYVRNLGVGGRTLLQHGDRPYMKEQAWRDALAMAPDVVIIKLGTNDTKPQNWQHAAEFEVDLQLMIDQLAPPQPATSKKAKLRKMLQRPQKPQIYLCTPIPAQQERWGISDSTLTNGVIPIIYKVAERNHLHVIDLHSRFADDGKLMQQDGIHPTDKGARRMAEIIAEELKKE